MSLSLYSMARAAREAGLQGDDLEPLQAAFKEEPTFLVALSSPRLTEEEVRDLLEPLHLPERAENLALLLRDKKQLDRLDDLIYLIEEQDARLLGGVVGLLRSARPISDEDTQRLEKATAKKLGKSFVKLKRIVQPELLGGFRITADGKTYDRTLAGELRDLAAWLQED